MHRFILIVALIAGIAAPSAGFALSNDDLTCVIADGSSYPAEVVSGEEVALDTTAVKRSTSKALKRLKNRVSASKKNIKRQKQLRKGLSKKQKNRANKKIAKLRARLIGYKDEQGDLKERLRLLNDCKDGGASAFFPRTLLVDSYSLDSGSSLQVENGVTIKSEQGISVNGDITVAEGTGGSVTLVAKDGDIDIGNGTTVRAGDGSAGEFRYQTIHFRKRSARASTTSVSGGTGIDGGSVILSAPGGTVRIGTGVKIHLGNGGAGGDLTVPSNKSVSTGAEVTLENSGGSSGGLAIDAQSVEGLDLTKTTIEGSPAWVLGSLEKISGGKGGATGSFVIGESKRLGKSDGIPSEIVVTSRRYKPIPARSRYFRRGEPINFTPDAYLRGARGAYAFSEPGDGQSVIGTFEDGKSFGDDGQGGGVEGGDGGRCRVSFSEFVFGLVVGGACIGGDGGDATVIGGSGFRGPHKDGFGGHGGTVFAYGGSGGRNFTKTGAEFEGKCGGAIAVGGDGAVGGGLCPKKVRDVGGFGGTAGGARAEADGCVYAVNYGLAFATGGKGGNGGEGRQTGGTPGAAPLSEVVAKGNLSSVAEQGTAGEAGNTCPPAAKPTATPTPTVPFKSENKSKFINFETKCPTSGFVTLLVDVFIPDNTTVNSTRFIDSGGSDLPEPICPGADEQRFVQIDPDDATAPAGKRVVRFTIVVEDASSDNDISWGGQVEFTRKG